MGADDSTTPNTPLESSPELSSGARFDDLRAGTSTGFSAPEKALTPHRQEDVMRSLPPCNKPLRTAGGLGYLAHEAAAGLDPDLECPPPDSHGPPLAWFGLTGPPHAVLDLEYRPVAHAQDTTSRARPATVSGPTDADPICSSAASVSGCFGAPSSGCAAPPGAPLPSPRLRSPSDQPGSPTGSSRTTIPLDVGVLLMSATLSRGTRTLVSG
ncbi:hypothetical protein GCM10027563_24210 [Parasphingorhabdus pacifica]